MSTSKSKHIVGYITIGILIGLAIAYIGYSLIQTKQLKSTVESQQKTISALEEQTDSIVKTKAANTNQEEQQQESLPQTESDLSAQLEPSIDASWKYAKDQNTFDSYLNFIKSNSTAHKNYNEGLHRLGQLGTRGWLYAGRTTDQSTYSEDQIIATTWRDGSAVTMSNTIPKIGDIVTLVSPSARRTYQNFTPRVEQNGVWQKEQEAYVSGIEIEGRTAVIIQVIYNQ